MTLQEILAEEITISQSNEPSKQGQRQRALVILHQMIDDAHQGKRQFLSGNCTIMYLVCIELYVIMSNSITIC